MIVTAKCKNLGAILRTLFFINSEVFEADLLISVGVILPIILQVSEERKSILPEVFKGNDRIKSF